MPLSQDLEDIRAFLGAPTPQSWVESAPNHLELLLIDHAHCEKKAAMTALNLINRYPNDAELLNKMSRLAREELRHFEQVLAIIKQRGFVFSKLTASRYASGLREHVRSNEPQRLVDLLIIGAFIEARSCERFAQVAPLLDEQLSDFYHSLLKSEARHYQDYLKLAKKYALSDTTERIALFREVETGLITRSDTEFRFHSGAPESLG